MLIKDFNIEMLPLISLSLFKDFLILRADFILNNGDQWEINSVNGSTLEVDN